MIRRWLMSLVGVRHDLIDETPTDGMRYIALSCVLLATAAIAAVSAAFAVQMALQLSPYWAVPVGIGWGVVILTLDRALVIGMTRHTSFWRNLLSALPRLALALLLGAVISTPLVLRIFQLEIDAEMQVLRQERKVSFQEKIKNTPRFAEIESLTKKLEEKNKIARQDPSAVIYNQSVIDAQKRVDEAVTKVENAEKDYKGEVDGSDGTHVPGIGDAARVKLDALTRAQQELSDAQSFLSGERTKATAALADEAPRAAADAAAIQADITDRTTDRDQQIATNRELEDKNKGLLARLEALGSLSDNRPDLARAQLLLFLLFLTIEILPVGVKLMYLSTPKTLYEKFHDDMETAAERSMAKSLNRYENVIDAFGDMRARLEFDQVDRQYEAGLRVNRRLVDEQTARAEADVSRFVREPGAANGHTSPQLFTRLRWSRLFESLSRHTPDHRSRTDNRPD